MSLYDLAIIGAGSSGLYLACVCHSLVPDMNIVILDSNPKLGRKLAITGNGRCNLTNNTLNIDEYFPISLRLLSGPTISMRRSLFSKTRSDLIPKTRVSSYIRLRLRVLR